MRNYTSALGSRLASTDVGFAGRPIEDLFLLFSAVIFPLGVNLFSSHPTGGTEGQGQATLCKYGRRQSSSKLKNVGLHASDRPMAFS